MALYKPGSSSSAGHQFLPPRTEFDILKDSHRFLREDDNDAKPHTWEDQVAQKYYERLFREYAVCDLKHYKSGNFALRWRTETEVISGAGETTCGNTRCALHPPRNHDPEDGADVMPGLKTLELPFSYVEKGENKLALVKVVLCDKCCKKLMWKRNKEKEKERLRESVQGVLEEADGGTTQVRVKEEEMAAEPALFPRSRQSRPGVEEASERRRTGRSRSPRRTTHGGTARRRRSP
ncbi:folate-sensitive fragile site protein Fra10Ac1-domain-containing protein [Cytidiella melzeri]|nr:folate-sensitive fragile site protein Fra10Ac1-domain-containing protein [Cytidiella melzeri]